MDKKGIIKQIFNSDIFNKWHFFRYHFEFYKSGSEHPLAKSVIDAIINIEKAIPHAGIDYIQKIANINSKENETAHYDKLLQVLAELLIVNKAVTHQWKGLEKFEYEPKSSTSNKNPEISITTDNLKLAIEVKSPEFTKKHNERGNNFTQLPSRSDLIKVVNISKTMLPRDNVVKDFLISANLKFEGFKKDNPNIYCVLVIVWDDFIYEPISAISSPQAGLFTQNSFAKDKQGSLLKFENIDCVIITRHLVLIKNGTRDELLPDLYQHPLDYGRKNEFPFKVMISNPNSKLTVPKEMVDCFQTEVPSSELGAEYLPIDIIHWSR